MVDIPLDKLKELFTKWYGDGPETITAIPPSGSERRYFRMTCQGTSAIGAWNPVKEENRAFIYFTRHFLEKGMHVPTILEVDHENDMYLIADLGRVSLFNHLENRPRNKRFSPALTRLYKESLKELIRFQLVGGKGLDYTYSYPHAAFDRKSMRWDLQYFKYYFLKLHTPFHEGKLEHDFDTLIEFLDKAKPDYFMYRDFQSRNIYIKDNKPYFIDYQGGRRGPLQYDVASLLFQVKADLPYDVRKELLDYYMEELSLQLDFDRTNFKDLYYGFVLMRLLQVLGAYGFRGLIEKKPHFLSSIPFALKNLDWWLSHIDLQLDLPVLLPALRSLTGLKKYQLDEQSSKEEALRVNIKSFSFKHGIPDDLSGHGGGFVFDCRALPNPGREEHYRAFNGKDQVIIDYLKDRQEVIVFLEETEKLVNQSVQNYLERGFGRLSVNFGCTGGQHRSVYCSEALAKRLRERFPHVLIDVDHVMLKV